ncbi:acetyltransferase [Gottschalkia purinilytica]|uniref:Acetyltransferase n=1 Tax=Gottschalkia purinilytica TaxID=1503 RepID=A0A0L0WD97_GOTPU|nr:GNAT family N-acetyltransferase [Gottschalkia purinilytica]KNF09416.1 acetyltransferase [Gottschalkia purinilytica]
MEEFNIRKATIEDTDKIHDLWKRLSLDQLNKDPYYKGAIDFHETKEMFEKALQDENCCIIIGEYGEKIVAFIELWIKNKDFYFFIDDYVYILHAFVDPEYRRQFKIARRMYREAENWARDKGFKYLQADVFEHNGRVMNFLGYFGFDKYRSRLIKTIQ